MDRDVEFANIRGGPRRQSDAALGPQSPTADHVAHNSTAIPGRVFGTDLTSYYNDSRYVPVTDAQREVQLYHGFRYGQTGFQKLDTTPGINRI